MMCVCVSELMRKKGLSWIVVTGWLLGYVMCICMQEIMYLKRQQQSPDAAAKDTYLGGQLLPISSPIGTFFP